MSWVSWRICFLACNCVKQWGGVGEDVGGVIEWGRLNRGGKHGNRCMEFVINIKIIAINLEFIKKYKDL